MYDSFINKIIDTSNYEFPRNKKEWIKYTEFVIKETFNEFAELKCPANKISEKNKELESNFEVLTHLGQGHFGSVYKVQNKHDRKIYAMKVVKWKSPKRAVKAMEEVINLAKLKENENVIKYYDTMKIEGITDNDDDMSKDIESYTYSQYSEDVSDETSKLHQSDGNNVAAKLLAGLKPKSDNEEDEIVTFTKLFIKMEYCDFDIEEVMKKIVEKKSTSTEENVFTIVNDHLGFKETKTNKKLGIFCPIHVLVQIARGLRFIHTNDIVHRDLKPSNIFLTTAGLIKIGDFGLSKDLSKSSPNQKLYGVGTHFYSAPEFLGHKGIELLLHNLPKADSFSFGMIALKILGFLIYDESELVRINDRVRNGNIY